MNKMLTGIRSTGEPHLGNILSVIIPSVKMANENKKFSSFIFIADLHSLIKNDNLNIKEIKCNTYKIISAWLAFGLDINNCFLFRQSDISEVTELAWYFSCFFPYNRLTLVHSFKKNYKKNNIKKTIKNSINVGLFTYPILMAADILLYDAEIIPVGKDQLQHIEITRTIANSINRKIKKNIFVIPKVFLQKKNQLVIGTDGNKMSKSKNNCINIFSSEKILKKQIMNIKTDNKSIEDKKDPDKDYIISIYKLIANEYKVDVMKKKYLNGGYGYLEAKIELYEHIMKKFSKERKMFFKFMKNIDFLDKILFYNAKKIKKIAHKKLNCIREHFNFNSLF
ncbi:tryptophan--tRNA ligase [Blattabacterium cuenoti]|uniref:tryptophan--tRNA ligase n=1 Tax=Blattabacterium cuenoti TaxID=1653831 RepID=UPI00163C5B6E|nr:tryptophan--tRNA ligase [Blattabacterium cuenoti]